jgi:hypothetical protein
MSEGLEKLKAILQGKLSDDEVREILAELTVASGEGSVLIGGDANESVVVTGNKNIVGDNNQVIINYGTDAEELRRMIYLIRLNNKTSNSQSADRKNRTMRGKVAGNNTTVAAKPPTIKKSTRSQKKPNTARISKNIYVFNNSRNSVPVRIKAVKEIGTDAKGDNLAISRLLSLIQTRNENNDLIAAGITSLSKISDIRASIVTTIISVLEVNKSNSVVISAMEAFAKIAINNSDAADKMLDLLSNSHNTIEMKESIIKNLGKVANGNKKAIDRLIPIINSNQDLMKTKRLTVTSLVQIAVGDPDTSSAMGDLLTDRNLSTSFKDYIALSLKKIDPSNPKLAEYNKAKTKRK